MDDLQKVANYIELKYPDALPFAKIFIERIKNNFKIHKIPIKYLEDYDVFEMGGYKKYNSFYITFEKFMYDIYFLLTDKYDDHAKLIDHINYVYREIQNTSTGILYEGDYVDIGPHRIVLIYNINNQCVLYTVVDDIVRKDIPDGYNVILDKWKYKNIKNSNKFGFIKPDIRSMTEDHICNIVKDKTNTHYCYYEYVNE